jgi:hypothetical protein
MSRTWPASHKPVQQELRLAVKRSETFNRFCGPPSSGLCQSKTKEAAEWHPEMIQANPRGAVDAS